MLNINYLKNTIFLFIFREISIFITASSEMIGFTLLNYENDTLSFSSISFRSVCICITALLL